MVKRTQTIRRLLLKNCLGVFDHFVGLVLKGLIKDSSSKTTVLVTRITTKYLEAILDELITKGVVFPVARLKNKMWNEK